MTKLRITVTKEILERSKMCGMAENIDEVNTNCAIALAVRDVFPRAYIESDEMWFDNNGSKGIGPKGYLPAKARHFINEFDLAEPDERAEMNPISFDINVPSSVIKKINIDELKPLLENHPTLALV